MKSKIAFFLMSFLLVALSRPLQAQVAVSLDASNPVDSPNLIGFSAGFNYRYMVVKTGGAWGTQVRPELVNELAKINKPLLRFPGGVIGNFYHLYPDGYDCASSNTPCVNDFAPGYGLRNVETVTHLSSVNGEQNFEDGNTIEDNWIVTLANLADAFKASTGDDLQIMYMANVVGHFKFGNQNAVFDPADPRFQRLLNETKDALRYLIGVRQLKVVGVELGTELYGPHWANNNDMDVDDFITLIPHYRALVDSIETEFSLGYDIPVAVPVSHTANLSPTANNFTRKLVDQIYYPAQDYDAWVIHDYQDIIPFCNQLNCNNCSDWIFDECELNQYSNLNQNNNIDECGPSMDDQPQDSVMQSVFEGRKGMLADTFHHGISNGLLATLQDFRGLSGKASAKTWITEWNLKMDGGCRDNLFTYNWKAVNQFFGNTLYHSMSLFEWLHSFYEADASSNASGGFVDFASVHSFLASNRQYPIFQTNVANTTFARNASSYAFMFTSELNGFAAQKIVVSAPVSNDFLVFHGYLDPGAGNNEVPVYLYYSNKSALPQSLDLPASLNFNNNTYTLDSSMTKLRCVKGANLYAAANADYSYGTANFNATAIDTTNAFVPLSYPGQIDVPEYSFGFFKLTYKQLGTAISEENNGSLKVYPNPALDRVRLEIQGGNTEMVVAELVDPIGRVLQSKQETAPGSFDFNTEKLPAGFYGIRVTNMSSGKLRFAKSVIKLKD
jgi:hypothetical protein